MLRKQKLRNTYKRLELDGSQNNRCSSREGVHKKERPEFGIKIRKKIKQSKIERR